MLSTEIKNTQENLLPKEIQFVLVKEKFTTIEILIYTKDWFFWVNLQSSERLADLAIALFNTSHRPFACEWLRPELFLNLKNSLRPCRTIIFHLDSRSEHGMSYWLQLCKRSKQRIKGKWIDVRQLCPAAGLGAEREPRDVRDDKRCEPCPRAWELSE